VRLILETNTAIINEKKQEEQFWRHY
jgi:hypothetical protein